MNKTEMMLIVDDNEINRMLLDNIFSGDYRILEAENGQEAMEKLMAGRTTIMVAHRLSTIQHADKIIVMHKGRIRESGTHQELLEQDGIYKKLYKLQLA